MTYTFYPMTQEEALIIANEWKYPDEFCFYNIAADEEDYREFITPECRKNYYAALDENGSLCGFLTFTLKDETEADLGIGLKPDQTGRGRGAQFLLECIEHCVSCCEKIRQITLSVAKFNQRAVKVYLKCGFSIESEQMVETNGGSYCFLLMKKIL